MMPINILIELIITVISSILIFFIVSTVSKTVQEDKDITPKERDIIATFNKNFLFVFIPFTSRIIKTNK